MCYKSTWLASIFNSLFKDLLQISCFLFLLLQLNVTCIQTYKQDDHLYRWRIKFNIYFFYNFEIDLGEKTLEDRQPSFVSVFWVERSTIITKEWLYLFDVRLKFTVLSIPFNDHRFKRR